MKIGILTLPLHTNYGGILQAYALQTVLERMGHNVIVFDPKWSLGRNKFRQNLSFCKYVIQKYLFRKEVKFYSIEDFQKQNTEREEREKFTRTFIHKYIKSFTIKKLCKDVPRDIDAIVVGSDQVWRHYYFTGSYHCGIENAFLQFAKNWKIKRISYAASFGTDDWEYSTKETKDCAVLLQRFNAVGVREATAVTLCKEKLGYNTAVHVLDPTMLLTKDDYIKLVEAANTPKSSGNLLCYILDESEEKLGLINDIAKERHLTPFSVNSRIGDPSAPQKDRIQPPVEQWLRGFMDAQFVITDSFHACVFSILFGKPFLVIGNKERGMARFDSLLSLFSLENHLISSADKYNPDLDYTITEETKNILKAKQELSVSFLKKV